MSVDFDPKQFLEYAYKQYTLYAKIKESSKYARQAEFAIRDGNYPFPVEITGDHEYNVQGGPGGQYRSEDVELFVKVKDTFIQISGNS